MKYRIVDEHNGFTVRIDEVAGQQQNVLARISQCRQSAWACPSAECRNVGSIDQRVEGESIFLTLNARAGTQLDRAGIEECLAYMLHDAVKIKE